MSNEPAPTPPQTHAALRWSLQTALQGLLVLGLVIFGFLLVEDMVVRWDLTEDDRFTISEASREMAAALDDPLTIRAYFSSEIPERYQPLQRQVMDILDEYEAASGGKVKVERNDPDESLAAKSAAEDYGFRQAQLFVADETEQRAVLVFGGVVLLYRDKTSEILEVASRYDQGFHGLSALEYEISSRIWQLANERPKVGLTGFLKSTPPPNPMNPQGGRPQPEFEGFRRLLGEAFLVEEIDLKQEEPDPATMPLLIVARPKEFDAVQTWRLDQYLMKGGRVLMFVTQGALESNPMYGGMLRFAPFSTGLDEWLQHHGLRIPNEFVCHAVNAVPVAKEQDIGGLRLQTQIPQIFWPVIGAEGAISQDNPAVQTLNAVSFFWPHPVDIIEGRVAEGVESEVLVKSHEKESWRWSDLKAIDIRNLNTDEIDPGPLRASPIVVALQGKFTSFYDGETRPAPPGVGTMAKTGEGEEATEELVRPDPIRESVDTQLVVVGNAIFVSDGALGGQQADERSRGRALLAFNLADWLARSPELIRMRSKSFRDRTIVDKEFEKTIEELRRKAEAQELSREELRQAFDEAQERQKTVRKRWRWLNVLGPLVLILVAGAIVWIVRAALRSRPVEIPPGVAPDGGEDLG